MKNKKILLAVLMIIMMVAVFSVNAFAANNQSVRGDLDGNNEINVDDAIYLLGYTIFPEYYPLSQSGDVDGNGEINIDDALHLLGYTIFPEYYPLAPDSAHEHSLVYHEAVAPGCDEPGSVEYWSCEGCELLFADDEATEEIPPYRVGL